MKKLIASLALGLAVLGYSATSFAEDAAASAPEAAPVAAVAAPEAASEPM
eukprot:gene6112-8282_t